jgi:hypothetical protein
MTKKDKKKPDIFYAPKTEKFVANHLEKIFSVFLIVPIFFFFKGELSLNTLLSVILLYITPLFIFIITQRKFAFKISIDFESQKIQFHMYRSNELIELNFNQIDEIRINGYVIFKLCDKKIFYKSLQNNKLFERINRIKKIKWGILCNIWGPSKEIRDKFQS